MVEVTGSVGRVGGKEISISRSSRHGSEDMLICEKVREKKYLLFITKETARRISKIGEDLVMQKSKANRWEFKEIGRNILMEIVSNNVGRSLMIRSETTDAKRWRRRIFIPEGITNEGWMSLSRRLNEISKSVVTSGFQMEQSQSQGWLKVKAELSSSNRFGEWDFAVVCKVEKDSVNWLEVGRRITEVFTTKEDFDFFPFDHNQAIITVYSEAERELLCSGNGLFREDEHITFFPWQPSINNKNTPLNANGGWIGLQGLPFHLWTHNFLRDFASKLGGLEEISEDTRLCNDLRLARIKVKGDLGRIPNRIIVEEGDEEFVISVHSIVEPSLNPEATIPIVTQSEAMDNEDEVALGEEDDYSSHIGDQDFEQNDPIVPEEDDESTFNDTIGAKLGNEVSIEVPAFMKEIKAVEEAKVRLLDESDSSRTITDIEIQSGTPPRNISQGLKRYTKFKHRYTGRPTGVWRYSNADTNGASMQTQELKTNKETGDEDVINGEFVLEGSVNSDMDESNSTKSLAQIVENLSQHPDDVNYIADFGDKAFGIRMDGKSLNYLNDMIRREKGFNLNLPPLSPTLSA